YAIGKALDDLGEYSRAIAHFDEANRNWCVGRDFDRNAHSKTVDQMTAIVDRNLVDRLNALGSTSDLPILVVGLPRSGTTLLEQVLVRHPEIGAGGEVEFWLQKVEAIQFGTRAMEEPDSVAGLAENYLSLLEKTAPGSLRVVDKMPHNYG